VLGDQLRLEGAVAVAGCVEDQFAQLAADGLVRVAVASVGCSSRGEGGVIVRRQGGGGLASEVDVPIGVEHPFEGGLHQGAHQGVEVVEGVGLGDEIADELLGLELDGFVHVRISVRKEG
jgi:hypothetical protein